MKRTEEQAAARRAARERKTRETIKHYDTLPDSAFIRLPVVCAIRGGVSAATIWRQCREGRLPAPQKLGPKITAWNVGKMRAHAAAEAAA